MRRRGCRAAAFALLICGLVGSGAHAHESHEVPEDSVDEPPLLFEPPAPGTYELPPIDHVDEHRLVGEDGEPALLPGLQPGRVGVVSFVYRSCVDARGCPLALAVMRRLDRELSRRPELARRVRLVTVSFDPERDTFKRMSELRELMQPKGDWRFLTAESEEAIQPVLRDFGQDAVRLATAENVESSVLRHVLKIFLVDENRAVRNIYSTGFLNWKILINDIQTVSESR
jgi:cytochrome oxidase Cu insertion factor (SCO1/SenC/PrrC family)